MWMCVLDGPMRLLLGEQDLVVEPGEAAEFSTLSPHRFVTIDGLSNSSLSSEAMANPPNATTEPACSGGQRQQTWDSARWSHRMPPPLPGAEQAKHRRGPDRHGT
jgi:hypothetical protein